MKPGPKGASGPGGEEEVLAVNAAEIPGRLDPRTVEAIGDALQTFYRALIDEPLPARLLALLAELEAKEGDDA